MYKKNLVFIVFMCGIFPMISWGQNKQFRALLFTKTAGFHHESIHDGVAAVKALAAKHHFDVDWHESTNMFTDERLERYDIIIFLNTTGDILNDDQQKAMEGFIQSGKGFVGIHSASDTEYDWPWYTKMVGHMFHIHPAVQTAKIRLLDANFPGLETMPSSRVWTDEWYEFTPAKTVGLKYLMAVDETTYEPQVKWGEKIGEGMGDLHPVSWYHEYDGGRAFYTAMGHVPATFHDPIFLDHLYGGIWWAATGRGIDAMN